MMMMMQENMRIQQQLMQQQMRQGEDVRLGSENRAWQEMMMQQMMNQQELIHRKLLMQDEKKEEEASGWFKDEPEKVMQVGALPTLERPGTAEASMACGDRVAKIDTSISSLSKTSKQSRFDIMKEAKVTYEQFQVATPMDKQLLVPKSNGIIEDPRYNQVMSRTSELLLAALDIELQKEMVARRLLHPLQLIYRVMTVYQPGGKVERQLVLNQLISPGTGQDAKEVVQTLRKWQRTFLRATELGLVVPDPIVLIKGVTRQ
jgi:hypothetical protein